LLEVIAWVRIGDRVLARLPIAELEELALLHDQGAFLSVGLGFAAAHGYPGAVLIRVYVDAVLAGPRDRECDVGRVDLDAVIAVHGPYPQAHRALV
jgi:hypothetical protein